MKSMQEEIENRTINLVITTSKLSVRVLMDGLRKFMQQTGVQTRRDQTRIAKAQVKARQKAEGPHTDLYERQGKAVTNFSLTLPAEQSDLAQAITRDPYNFDFLTIREKYDEKELKSALMDKVENFLMELGTGFAYMGREVRILIGGKEKFLDMLFYNANMNFLRVLFIYQITMDNLKKQRKPLLVRQLPYGSLTIQQRKI